MNFDEVRRIALALPGVEEGTSYGTPAFRVRGKFFARLREDGESLVLKCNLFERQYLVDDLPEVFYITDHYRDYPAVLVRISAVTPELLRERMEASWRIAAPKKLIAELDARAG
ncbi:MAG TPA: MmcQ/YjbR family DNA-binding protein [Longimicrobium sp.]|nr:MmcQ/YjbR family DNA-binding protein [Longimicrobium sp.]